MAKNIIYYTVWMYFGWTTLLGYFLMFELTYQMFFDVFISHLVGIIGLLVSIIAFDLGIRTALKGD
jgi:hypothetical protein